MVLMKRNRVKLSDQIRQAIEDCGQTRYAISKATGISQATFSRFMSGERGLPMNTLDRLAEYLDLNLALRKPTKKGKVNP
jgi:transcriptional regulator with XRE-family HTH domain